jgi:Mn-dependent DtxR family transcriptional regulator
MTDKADVYKFIDEHGPVKSQSIEDALGIDFHEAQDMITDLRSMGRVRMTSDLEYETT